MTGVSYAEITIGKQEIGVWLQLNLRELKFARQFDRNSDLLITEPEVQAGTRQFEPQLLEQFRIFGNGEEGQGRLVEVTFNPQRGELRCHLIYTFARPLEDVIFRVTLHSLTDSGHWDLARMRYDGLEEQRYFNLETPEGRVELRRGPRSYFRLAGRSAIYALREFVSTPETPAFLLALLLIEKTWEGLGFVVALFCFGQAVAFSFDSWRGPFLSVRFVQSAVPLSVAYVAAENVFIREVRYRGMIAAFLGFIYGLSYSDLARSIGYPKKGMVLSLLSFQSGLLVAVGLWSVLVFLALSHLKRIPLSRQVLWLFSIGLIGLGVGRFVQVTF